MPRKRGRRAASTPAHRRAAPPRTATGDERAQVKGGLRQLMVTPTFVFSVTVVTMAILAFGTTQTYLRFSSSGPGRACGVSGCANPDASHRAQNGTPGSSVASPDVGTNGSHGSKDGHSARHGSYVVISLRTVRTVPGGFVARFSITERRARPVKNWRLWVRYPGVRITWMSGARWVPGKNGAVTITPLPGSPPLREGKSLPVTFGASGVPAGSLDCFFDDARCHIAT
jgi:hypothetical protein